MMTIMIVINIASIYVLVFKSPDFGARSPGFRSKLCHVSQLCTLVNYSAFLLPVSETGQITVSTSLGYYKD